MFGYLLIGIELLVLYIIFWVVFIREPRPKEIRAELWGHYDGIANELSSQPSAILQYPYKNTDQLQAQNQVPIETQIKARSQILGQNQTIAWPSRIKSRFNRMARARRLKQYLRNKHKCECNCHANACSGHFWKERQIPRLRQDINREIAEKLLLILNRALNKFSVKIPR